MDGVPTCFVRKCAFEYCGHDELDIREPGVFQYKEGWEMKREGGGGHGLSCAKAHDKYAHRHCVERAASKYGNQGSLI
jgi:hypothetical protein